MTTPGKLPREFYARDTVQVARELLGKRLVHVDDGIVRVGTIVEVEAYLGPRDRAAHSSRGRTRRTEVMFGPPGHAYVFLIYGMHCCMNIVTEGQRGTAVLLRALEPQSNLAGRSSGPGLLCKAMALDCSHNGHDLLSDSLHVIDVAQAEAPAIVVRPRVGVDYAGSWAKRLLRFYIKGNRFVSRP